MTASEGADLGYRHRRLKNGDVEILHHGRVASTLRGDAAARFLSDVDAGDDAGTQQLMARLTGNYKRGNERLAREHPRNRR